RARGSPAACRRSRRAAALRSTTTRSRPPSGRRRGHAPGGRGATAAPPRGRARRRGAVRSVESHGKTVDEAISQALRRLGRQRDEVDITVLSEGSRGVFGIGAEDARVRVTVREAEGAAVGPPAEQEAVPLERLPEVAEDMLTDLLEL